MINFQNKKGRSILTTIIIIIVVLAMVIPGALGTLSMVF